MNHVVQKAAFFQLQEVSLLGKDSIFVQNRNRTLDYLRLLNTDRMLYNFRKAYGQDTLGVQPLGGWEAPDGLLRGHSTGHFLSALALAYAATGEEVFQCKLNGIVSELVRLQNLCHGSPAAFQTRCTPQNVAQSLWSTNPAEWGEDYLGAYPPDQFALLEQLVPYQSIWAPYYTLHKLLAGLLDCFQYAGNRQALTAAQGIGNWVYRRLTAVPQEQRERMWNLYIAGEYGGMNESLALLYSLTGNKEYLDAARLFDNTDFIVNLAQNTENLHGRHANQHIPQLIGAVWEYETTGDIRYLNAAKNFWEFAVTEYAYSIGGVGAQEKFTEPNRQAEFILEDRNCETCAAYNMLKLTKALYRYEPEYAAYMEYYEKALLNQIAASQNPLVTAEMHSGVTYMLPIAPGQQKIFSDDYDTFTCCHGTGMENHVKYPEAAYAVSADAKTLYVNLYLPCVLNWAEKGITIRQETHFPSPDTVFFVNGGSFTLKLRVPSWAAEFTVRRNGTVVLKNPPVGTYAQLSVWDGDILSVHMPYRIYLEKTPDRLDGCEVASVMYGPLVMAAKAEQKDWITLHLPENFADAFIESRTDGIVSLSFHGLTFLPMYAVSNCRYHAYVKIVDERKKYEPQSLQKKR